MKLRYQLFFFFQAEDGIRDRNVTGVQTCALPISASTAPRTSRGSWREPRRRARALPRRSEERRVGKSVDLGGRRIIKKKKQINSKGREGKERWVEWKGIVVVGRGSR